MSSVQLRLTPERAEALEKTARAFADQLRQAMTTTRNWSAVGGPQGRALRNEWGLFAYTAVEQPAAINPHVDIVKQWRVHHYLLTAVFTKMSDVDATHDFPIFLHRVAYYLGAVNPLEMRRGVVEATPGDGATLASGPVVVTPVGRKPDEVITLRWDAPRETLAGG